MTLAEFVNETRDQAVKFEWAYEAAHKENPEQYPLTLAEDNSGLWFEMFMTFCESGSI